MNEARLPETEGGLCKPPICETPDGRGRSKAGRVFVCRPTAGGKVEYS